MTCGNRGGISTGGRRGRRSGQGPELSGRRQLNLLAKIGLLWYEINYFSNAKKPTVLRTAPCPKTDRRRLPLLANPRPEVFYCQMRRSELENSVFSGEFPVRSNEFPVPMENREVMRNALGLQHKSRQGADRSHRNGQEFRKFPDNFPVLSSPPGFGRPTGHETLLLCCRVGGTRGR
jgi:hypothetical protein